MYTMPQPPTDNLYKFLAVSGLAMVLVGTAMPFVIFRTLGDADHQEIIALRAKQQDNLFRQIELLLKDAVANNQKVNDALLKCMEMLNGRAEKDILALDRHFETSLKQAELQARALICLGAFGVGIGVFGFWFWWLKVQRWQDRLLRLEVNKIEEETIG